MLPFAARPRVLPPVGEGDDTSPPAADDPYALSAGVGRDAPNRRDDVLRVETVLSRLGRFDATPTGGPTGYPGMRLVESLTGLQKDHGLTVDGRALPGGETLGAMRTEDVALGGQVKPAAQPADYRPEVSAPIVQPVTLLTRSPGAVAAGKASGHTRGGLHLAAAEWPQPGDLDPAFRRTDVWRGFSNREMAERMGLDPDLVEAAGLPAIRAMQGVANYRSLNDRDQEKVMAAVNKLGKEGHGRLAFDMRGAAASTEPLPDQHMWGIPTEELRERRTNDLNAAEIFLKLGTFPATPAWLGVFLLFNAIISSSAARRKEKEILRRRPKAAGARGNRIQEVPAHTKAGPTTAP